MFSLSLILLFTGTIIIFYEIVRDPCSSWSMYLSLTHHFQIVLAAPRPISWEICSGDHAHGELKSVEIVNNPVVPGQNTTVYGVGTLDKAVTSGTWYLEGRYLGIKLLTRSGDLCSNSVVDLPFGSGHIYINGLQCPTNPGRVKVEQKALFNYQPPIGTYSIKCKMMDQDNEEILCLDIDVPM